MSDWSNYGNEEPEQAPVYPDAGYNPGFVGAGYQESVYPDAGYNTGFVGAGNTSYQQSGGYDPSYVQPYPRPSSQTPERSAPESGESDGFGELSKAINHVSDSSFMSKLDAGAGQAVHSVSEGVDTALNSSVGQAVTGVAGQALDIAGNPLKYMRMEGDLAEKGVSAVAGKTAGHAVSVGGDFMEMTTSLATLDMDGYKTAMSDMKDDTVATVKSGAGALKDGAEAGLGVVKDAGGAIKDGAEAVGDKAKDVAKDIGHAFGL